MTDLTEQARPAVELLMEDDVDALYIALANRHRAVENAPQIAGQFDYPQVQLLGPVDDLRDFGQRFFAKYKAQAYAMLCGTDDEHEQQREEVRNAILNGKESVATAIATLLVTNLGIMPVLAAVLGVLIVKLFFKPAYEAMCETFKASFEDAPATDGGSTT